MNLWSALMQAIGRPPDIPRDPAVKAVASASQAKADHTHQLLAELRSRTPARLERARLRYDERLHGNRRRTAH